MQQDFIESLGPAFLAHLMRRLSDAIVEGCTKWHEEIGIPTTPRTSSTLLALDAHGRLAVTELATLLRQSHPMVIKWVRLLRQQGLARIGKDPNDARRSLVSLTAKGRSVVQQLRDALVLVEQAVAELAEESAADLVSGLWSMERALRDRPFIERLRAQQRPAVS